MKFQLIAIGILFVLCASACGNHSGKVAAKDSTGVHETGVTTAAHRDTFPSGKVIPQVVCQSDTSESYAIYIPVSGNQEALPVVYFFDPHGDGSLPLVEYRTLADRFHFIFIGSNNSRNGEDLQTEDRIWGKLWNDTRNRINLDNRRIYVCGFSGGAKVASYLGLAHPNIAGVIADGAGLRQMESGGNFSFSFTAIAGLGDMNMTDLVAINEGLDKTTTRHRLILFDGKHQWAPLDIMNIALTGLQFDAINQKIIPGDPQLTGHFITASNNRIESLVAENQLVRAHEECQLSIHMLQGISSQVSHFVARDAAIQKSPEYKKQLQKDQELLSTEEKIKNIFNQQFQAGDQAYWNKTIQIVQQKSRAKTAEGAMYQRLQAYLSLAFYTISNQMISANRNLDAQYFVDLYKRDDPSNSEAWYFSAILNARNHNPSAAGNDLLKAVACGFDDKKRLEAQPEFQDLGPGFSINTIETKMKPQSR